MCIPSSNSIHQQIFNFLWRILVFSIRRTGRLLVVFGISCYRFNSCFCFLPEFIHFFIQFSVFPLTVTNYFAKNAKTRIMIYIHHRWGNLLCTFLQLCSLCTPLKNEKLSPNTSLSWFIRDILSLKICFQKHCLLVIISNK